jgi:hypothetical protein
MREAAEVMRLAHGCLDAAVWEVRESEAVVSTGTFASEQAWAQAVQAVLNAKVDFDYDERELHPRDVYFLERLE